MDYEYAEDTTLYKRFSEEGLDVVRTALDMFWIASGAKIIWSMSFGFLIGVNVSCTWGLADPSFTWIQPG